MLQSSFQRHGHELAKNDGGLVAVTDDDHPHPDVTTIQEPRWKCRWPTTNNDVVHVLPSFSVGRRIDPGRTVEHPGGRVC